MTSPITNLDVQLALTDKQRFDGSDEVVLEAAYVDGAGVARLVVKHRLVVIRLVGAQLLNEVLERQVLVLSLSFLVLLLQSRSVRRDVTNAYACDFR